MPWPMPSVTVRVRRSALGGPVEVVAGGVGAPGGRRQRTPGGRSRALAGVATASRQRGCGRGCGEPADRGRCPGPPWRSRAGGRCELAAAEHGGRVRGSGATRTERAPSRSPWTVRGRRISWVTRSAVTSTTGLWGGKCGVGGDRAPVCGTWDRLQEGEAVVGQEKCDLLGAGDSGRQHPGGGDQCMGRNGPESALHGRDRFGSTHGAPSPSIGPPHCRGEGRLPSAAGRRTAAAGNRRQPVSVRVARQELRIGEVRHNRRQTSSSRSDS